MANVKNNARKRESKRRIREAFVAEFHEQGALERVSVSAICARAHMNRSTFYATYRDVYDLAEKTCDELRGQVSELFREEHEQGFNSNDFLKIFRHMKEHRELYLLCFQLGVGDVPITSFRYDTRLAERDLNNKLVEYHKEFFRASFNGIARKWLEGGCIESPEDIDEIIHMEYRGRE